MEKSFCQLWWMGGVGVASNQIYCSFMGKDSLQELFSLTWELNWLCEFCHTGSTKSINWLFVFHPKWILQIPLWLDKFGRHGEMLMQSLLDSVMQLMKSNHTTVEDTSHMLPWAWRVVYNSYPIVASPEVIYCMQMQQCSVLYILILSLFAPVFDTVYISYSCFTCHAMCISSIFFRKFDYTDPNSYQVSAPAQPSHNYLTRTFCSLWWK